MAAIAYFYLSPVEILPEALQTRLSREQPHSPDRGNLIFTVYIRNRSCFFFLD
ncbi:hypothetical protein [Desulfosediminicola ganghwensis]|uniref:hypothetical protein n=1 Tax=Desulfosediminicola ganghwensis TaxID=2569540 RepID=UPI0012948504|nr:hypothetical protein [Desulfosediminicola ganghwensis]